MVTVIIHVGHPTYALTQKGIYDKIINENKTLTFKLSASDSSGNAYSGINALMYNAKDPGGTNNTFSQKSDPYDLNKGYFPSINNHT